MTTEPPNGSSPFRPARDPVARRRQRTGTQSAVPLFALGRTVATPGALRLFTDAGVNAFALLRRHQYGDWGDLDAHDKRENDYAVTRRLRILSAYNVARAGGGVARVWVITEADRSATTFLLPSEY